MSIHSLLTIKGLVSSKLLLDKRTDYRADYAILLEMGSITYAYFGLVLTQIFRILLRYLYKILAAENSAADYVN